MVDSVKAISYLPDAATCTICWEMFNEPVTLDCGHNFCSSCITMYWEGSKTTCPQCKCTLPSAILRPNRQLGNIAWLLKQFRKEEVDIVKKKVRKDICQEHQKPQVIFCREDGNLLCLDCDTSRAHRNHLLISAEDAAHQYKYEVKVVLDVMKIMRENVRDSYTDLRLEKHNLVRLMEEGATKLSVEYKELLDLVRTIQTEQVTLAKLIEKELDEEISRLWKRRCYMKKLHGELQQKCELPDVEFLQDIKGILIKCREEHAQPLECPPLDAKEKLWDFARRNLFVRDMLKRCRANMQGQQKVEKAMVTLDPTTAFSKLRLAQDCKGVMHEPRAASQVTGPLAFDTSPCVLGSEGFSVGRYCWEVEIISDGEGWALGVAKESVKKKGAIAVGQHEGIWALPAESTGQLAEREGNVRIRMYLYYEAGELEFFDAFSKNLIVSYRSLSFGREKVFPFFMLGRQSSHMKLCF